MEFPEVRYVITDDDVRIAYQDFGSGPPTVFVPTILGHLEGYWEFEPLRRLYERMAANLRILMFDHRGNGMSDGFKEPPSLEDRALDVEAVIDNVAVEQANLLGFAYGAQVAIGFAAQYPERVDRLTLANARVGLSAKSRAEELNPGAGQPDPSGSAEAALQTFDMVGIEVDESFTHFSPSAAKSPDDLRLVPKFQALVGTRDVYERQIKSFVDFDVVDIAPLVRAPTLVTHTRGNRLLHVGYARLLAELIPDSTLVEFEGDDHMFWLADNWRDIVDAQIRFITDSDVDAPVERRFAVIVFTDIVGSTSASLASGDDEWHRRLDTHDRISRRVITRHAGSVIKNTGDGFLATFNTPSQAVDAVVQLRDELADASIPIRAGIHAGEVEVRGDDIAGAVVNLAARVEQTASEDDIYATATIKDMLIGSHHNFESVGSHKLKGFDGDWPLYRIALN
jgi:class 3 adenylate cyclase